MMNSIVKQLKEICTRFYETDPTSQGVLINKDLYDALVQTNNFQQFSDGSRLYFKLGELQVYLDFEIPLFACQEYTLWDPTVTLIEFNLSAHQKLEIMKDLQNVLHV